jgi:hypothetical protein
VVDIADPYVIASADDRRYTTFGGSQDRDRMAQAHSDTATLQRFPVVASTGLSGLEAGVSRLFGDSRLGAPRETRNARFKSQINYRPLKHLGLL